MIPSILLQHLSCELAHDRRSWATVLRDATKTQGAQHNQTHMSAVTTSNSPKQLSQQFYNDVDKTHPTTISVEKCFAFLYEEGRLHDVVSTLGEGGVDLPIPRLEL